MAKVNYYIYQGKKSDSERVEIKMRFVSGTSLAKRYSTGIFIAANNWYEKTGFPKEKRLQKNYDECREISSRLHLLKDYLLGKWSETVDVDLTGDVVDGWVNDIVWEEVKDEDGAMNQRQWVIKSYKEEKRRKLEEKRIREKLENRFFVDVFREYVDEQLKLGVIVPVRHKTYQTCIGLWERMERYLGKRFKLNEVTTSDLNDFRGFVLDEYKLWEEVDVKEGKKVQKKLVPKKKYVKVYDGYESSLKRGVEPRSLNYVVVQIKYIKAFWHWLVKVKKAKLEDVFSGFNMDQSVYGTPYFLGTEDRKIMFQADLSDRPALAVQRDIFVFQSLVGCRCGDLYRFTEENIVGGECLQYVAGKTKNSSGKLLVIPLHPDAKTIIERYRDSSRKSLLPFISQQKYNDAIKEVFKAIPEIDYTVMILDPVTRLETKKQLHEIASSHMARRNFCGNLYDAGFRDSDISAMSGHTEGSVAISRYRKVSDETRQKMIDSL